MLKLRDILSITGSRFKSCICNIIRKIMYNFDKICRTCSIQDNNLLSLFETLDSKLPTMIMAIANVHITKEDGLPSNICSNCISTVKAAFIFKKTCEETNEKFLANLLQDKVKDEEYSEFKNEDANQTDDEDKYIEEEYIEDSTSFVENLELSNDDKKITENPSQSSFDSGNTFPLEIEITEDKKNRARKCKIKKDEIREICSTCGKSFASKKTLKEHIIVHTKEKPFECKICGKAFGIKSNLTRHSKIHTGEKPFGCKICGKHFIQNVHLQKHALVHTDPSEKALMKKPTYKKQSTEKFQCDTCFKWYSSKPILRTHQLIHGEKKYLCSVCGKKFANHPLLLSHSKVHLVDKPFACEYCSKRFSQRPYLQVHQLIHTGEKPWVCQYCPKAFTQRVHLRKHLRIHKGERPCECTICGKRFRVSSTLAVHMRIHTGEKPFVCSVCDRGFYDSSSMKKHQAKHNVDNSAKEKNSRE